jgi:phosphatidylglycerophosphate synthase
VAGVTLDQVRSTYKARDSWWTVLLVDPLAARIVRLIVGRAWLTPTRLTIIAFALGLGAAAAFLTARPAWLVTGALLYYASFTIDCVDGKVARLRDEGSVVGSWLDFLLDRIRVVVATAALFGGQFLAAENPAFLVAAAMVVFLSLFGYLNGAEVDKARQLMKRLATLRDPGGAARGGVETARSPGPAARLGDALHRRRIRMNLVSGVEFDMALFVLAPLFVAALGAGALIGVVVVVGALLIVFELALITRFWLAASAFDRQWRRSSVPAQRDLAHLDDQTPAGR